MLDVTNHQVAGALISRIVEGADANAPCRAGVPFPDAPSRPVAPSTVRNFVLRRIEIGMSQTAAGQAT